MNKNKFKLLILILSLIVTGLFCTGLFCSISLPKSRVMLEEIPQYPDSVFFNEFSTSWPDDQPGVGKRYKSEDEIVKIVEFYLEELPKLNWELKSKFSSTEPAVPHVLYFEKNKWIWKYKACLIIKKADEENMITIKVEWELRYI